MGKRGVVSNKKYSVDEYREAKEDAKQMGAVLAKLEIMHSDIIEIKKGHTSLDDRINKIETRCSVEKVKFDELEEDVKKVAGWQGGKFGFIGSTILFLIVSIIYFVLTGKLPGS